MGPRSKRKRKVDITSSKSKGLTNDVSASEPEALKKARTKGTKGVVGQQEDPLSEYEREEDWTNMADVSGFSRYSIESIEPLQDQDGLETSGVTDTEVLNSSKEKDGYIDEITDEVEETLDHEHNKAPLKRVVEERTRLPSWRREGELRGLPLQGRRIRAANMEKITGRQHPMVYEQQSYTSRLPLWEEDLGRSGGRVGGYLTYQDDSYKPDSEAGSDDAEGKGIWREVGHFNTADRRRLHGDYEEYLYGSNEDESPVSAMRGLAYGGSEGVMTRRHMHKRRKFQEDYSRYSLAAHALSSFIVFCFMLLTFVAVQYFRVFGSLYDRITWTGIHMLQLYGDIRADNLPRIADCTTTVNLLKIAECEIQTAFNRLLRHSVDQTMQFVSLALKADNVPHVVALLLGAYTALKTLLWTVHRPLLAAFHFVGSFLTSVYGRCLRTCERSGI